MNKLNLNVSSGSFQVFTEPNYCLIYGYEYAVLSGTLDFHSADETLCCINSLLFVEEKTSVSSTLWF